MFTSIALPAGLYWFFAVPESQNPYTAVFLTGSFSAFSFFGIVFLQYSINTAQEKSSPWAHYLNTLPIRYWQVIVSRLITSILLGWLSCCLIYLVSHWCTPTNLNIVRLTHMLCLLTVGSLPFLLMGLLVGELMSHKAVVPTANFIHLILSFAGGLWKPPELLPEALQVISPWLPTYHYGLLTWSISSPEIRIEPKNILYLVLFSLVMAAGLFLVKKRQLKA